MNILYSSTRGANVRVTASEAILMGLAPDGGLFVPSVIPTLDRPLEKLAGLDYKSLALEVMRLFLTDYSEEELADCIDKAYDEKFDTAQIVELAQAGEAYYLELHHGPTIAFKDMALSILPHLMTTAMKKKGSGEEIVILTATSGDTGKAALQGFADVEGTRIVVFYPKGGTSRIQELQMTTQRGDNTCVIGIEGNFDEAQTGVKKMFTDAMLERELTKRQMRFSSANSINVGRLVPQIVYYVYSYCRLLQEGRIAKGEAINFTVPTGNFGNILAAYYAMKLGVPVNRLICASNSNKVLTDFFRTGTYDKNREFLLTASPSMDILVSSNLERLIYHIAGNDAERDAEYMHFLNLNGRYEITQDMLKQTGIFHADFATEEETAQAIRRTYFDHGYLTDPHTAVATAVYEKYRAETGDETKTVIVSTASAYKFPGFVLRSLGQETDADDFVQLRRLSEVTGTSVPGAASSLESEPVRHETVCARQDMKKEVMKFLQIG